MNIRLINPIIVVAFMVLGAPVLAGTPASADAKTGKAFVTGYPPAPARYIFELRFTAVNGEEILPINRLNLEPGTHTLTVRVPAEYTRAAVAQRKRSWAEDVDFEVTVEADARYRVRGQWNRNDLGNPYDIVFERVR